MVPPVPLNRMLPVLARLAVVLLVPGLEVLVLVLPLVLPLMVLILVALLMILAAALLSALLPLNRDTTLFLRVAYGVCPVCFCVLRWTF